jgi:ketosteroid isomerase-like protein
VTRSEIESAFKKLGAPLAAGDIDGWCERFAPDCSFVNSQLTEPVIGREALRAMAREWPKVDNRPEWIAIDGNRVVMCWNECVVSETGNSGRYRGISTFVFNEDGLIQGYEGMFDTAAVERARAA